MLHTRTIKEAAAHFRAADPQTCLTETAIRTLLRTGAVPCIRVGKKYLVTLEAIENYISSGTAQRPENKQNSGKPIWQIR